MTSFEDHYTAAEAAKTAYQRYGLQADALQGWLAAEVEYLKARGINLFVSPSVAPVGPEQRQIFNTLAASLCNLRHEHFHGLASAA